MKFATLTVNDVQHEFIKMYKPELEKATNNRIKVEIYPAGQLGGAPRQAEGLRLGTIEAATGPAELFVGADPRFQGLAMAGLFKDLAHVRRAILVPQFRQAVSEACRSRARRASEGVLIPARRASKGEPSALAGASGW